MIDVPLSLPQSLDKQMSEKSLYLNYFGKSLYSQKLDGPSMCFSFSRQ